MCVHWHNWTNLTTEFNTDFISLYCPLNSMLGIQEGPTTFMCDTPSNAFFPNQRLPHKVNSKYDENEEKNVAPDWAPASVENPFLALSTWTTRIMIRKKKKAEIYENRMMIVGMRCVHVNRCFSSTHFRSFYHYIRCRMSKNVGVWDE